MGLSFRWFCRSGRFVVGYVYHGVGLSGGGLPGVGLSMYQTFSPFFAISIISSCYIWALCCSKLSNITAWIDRIGQNRMLRYIRPIIVNENFQSECKNLTKK